MSELGPPRRAAGVICLRRSDHKMLLLRHTRGGHWGIPKGHKDDEDPDDLACALRELEEEAGGEVEVIPGFLREAHYIVPASEDRPAHPKTVVHFLGWWPEDLSVRLSFEHDAARFVSEDELDALIPFPDLRPIFHEAFAFVKK